MTTDNKEGKTLAELSKEILTTESEPTVSNGETLKANNLRIIHFRPSGKFHGMSVCYREKNRNVIEISTAIVHPYDTFTKKVGAKTAIDNFLAGRTVYVPKVQANSSPMETLVYLFA